MSPISKSVRVVNFVVFVCEREEIVCLKICRLVDGSIGCRPILWAQLKKSGDCVGARFDRLTVCAKNRNW